ncbi:MAG: hypothetical protein FJZ00_14480, partial [Candidatus Sericytochromatia bacterium]|nr:hypothetical protein [Candidatus Tanganyikabacteria bacterium]
MAQVIGNYVYVFGGASSNGTTDNITSVVRATVNADGTLGAFATVAGINLVTARTYATSIVTGPYLYVISGNFPGTNTVERAAIDAGGNLGAFATVAGLTVTTARFSAGLSRVGNTVYVIGVENGSGMIDKIDQATIGRR